MMGMGFPRDQCVAAYRAAFFNGDWAVDYLLNGIPEGILDDAPASHGHAPPVSHPGAGGLPAPGGAGPDFSALTSNPMFEQLREWIIQDPQFFQQFMGTLS